MNHLYEAVIIAGRSQEITELGGWTCGHIGCSTGPKCVNGIVSIAAGAEYPEYIYDMPDELHPALCLVAMALIENTPAEVLKHYVPEGYEWDNVGNLGDHLVSINDTRVKNNEVDECGDPIYEPVLNKKLAVGWFKAAFETLASQLPEPPAALTVEEILSTPMSIPASEPQHVVA